MIITLNATCHNLIQERHYLIYLIYHTTTKNMCDLTTIGLDWTSTTITTARTKDGCSVFVPQQVGKCGDARTLKVVPGGTWYVSSKNTCPLGVQPSSELTTVLSLQLALTSPPWGEVKANVALLLGSKGEGGHHTEGIRFSLLPAVCLWLMCLEGNSSSISRYDL